MRRWAAIVLLFLTTVVLAQDSSIVRSKWRIGASGIVGAGYRHLVSDGSSTYNGTLIALRDDLEEPAPVFGGGVDVTFDLSPHWSLASGPQFLDLGYRTDRMPVVSVDPEEVDPTLAESGRINYHYQYMSLPLLVRYRIGSGRFQFEPALGVAGDLLLDAYTVIELFGPYGLEDLERNSAPYEELRRMTISAVGELNLHYHMGRRWELRLAPQARYQAMVLSDTPISDRLYTGGLTLGCMFRL